MSIVNMFGFDQMPNRSPVNRAQILVEGFDGLDAYSNATVFSVARANGRAWLFASQAYYASSSSLVTRVNYLFGNGRTLADIFGKPATLKLGVIGSRLWVDQSFIDRFINANNSATIMAFPGTDLSPSLKSALTLGEHFVEFEFDFVSNTVKTYLNASLISTYQHPSQLTGTEQLSYGLSTVSAQNAALVLAIGFTDIYVTHDNNDGEISGRLGPVKVLPLTVDKTDRPANWGYSDADAFYAYPDFDIGEGVTATYNGHLLIPRFTDTADLAGQFKYESTPLPSTPLGNRFNPPNWLAEPWSVPNANAVITHNFTFSRAKKVTAYAVGSWTPTYGAFDSWSFEGSTDGQSWTQLDARSGMAPKFFQGSYKNWAFKLAANKVGTYRYYRLVVTKSVYGSQSSSIIYMAHLQLLGDPADAVDNGLLDGLARVPNIAASDMDYPVIRTGIDGSEGSFGFTVPEFGTAQVLGVRVGLTGRREQASSEHIRAKLKLGASDGVEKVFELKPHTERHEMFPLAPKAPDGTPWSKANLETLRIVVKSKNGAK